MDSELPGAVGAVAMVFVDDLDHPDPSSDDRHHLFDVLRLQPGETVVVSNGHGAWSTARITADGLGPLDPVRFTERPAPEIVVAFAPVKGDRTPWLVAKLTEIGVDRMVPITTDRSVVRWEGDRGARTVAKLSRTAREAAAQSRRAHLPVIGEPTDLEGLAAIGTLHLAVPGGRPPVAVHSQADVPALVVAVGPEGGWSPAELASVPEACRIGLGPTILRAETASVVSATLLCALRSGIVSPNHH